MILSCPLCRARYLISAGLFAAGPRQVRCAQCKHGWQADAPAHIDAVGTALDAHLAPPPESVNPLPPGSNLPAIRREPMNPLLRKALQIIGGILAAVFLLWFLFDRATIVKQWPSLGGFYDMIGLHVYRLGEGLSIEDVHSEMRYEDGVTKLVIEGQIHNETKKMQEVPDIMASAAGSNGDIMQSWQINAPIARLAPEETQPFRSAIDAPKGTVVEVNLIFIEPKNAASE